MGLEWYVLHAKPHKESSLYGQLIEEGWECYFPCLKTTPINPRSRDTRPYFPGYLFVHLDLKEEGTDPFRWTPGSLGLVRFGEEPAIVPEAVITGVRHAVAALESAGGKVFCHLQPGDEVVIEKGPFSGFEAVFNACRSGQERVRVLLKTLSETREIPVELELGAVRKLA